jgi:tetratricopeptide (TPR) repeat protein
MNNLASILILAGRYDESLELLDNALKLNPNSVSALANRVNAISNSETQMRTSPEQFVSLNLISEQIAEITGQ